MQICLRFKERVWPPEAHGVICAGCFIPEMWMPPSDPLPNLASPAQPPPHVECSAIDPCRPAALLQQGELDATGAFESVGPSESVASEDMASEDMASEDMASEDVRGRFKVVAFATGVRATEIGSIPPEEALELCLQQVRWRDPVRG